MRRFYFEFGIGTSSDKTGDKLKREAMLNKTVPVVTIILFIVSIVVMKSMGM